MRVISVCSGAGGKDLGFHRAGFRTVALCEVDPWRRRLLSRNFPGVPCWPDLTTLDPDELPDADVLIGGTPCQDLSHAGRRAGLDGERSGLFFDYVRIRNALNVEWAVWENVEGALTSNGGLDFACVLGAFVGADVAAPAGGWPGAGVAAGPWGGAVWRVLDAQHFGVPQRRRRVFVAGRLGGPCPPEVLLEPARGGGNLAQGRGSRQGAPGVSAVGAITAGGPGRLDDHAAGAGQIIGTLQAKSPESGGWRIGADEAAAGQLVPALVSRSSRGKPTPLAPGHNGADEHIVAYTVNAAASTARERHAFRTGTARSLDSNGGYAAGQGGTVVSAPADADGVRAADGLAGRLDVAPMTGGFLSAQVTKIASCAVDLQPDGRRYSACGDGVVAPVAEWIGRRLLSTARVA